MMKAVRDVSIASGVSRRTLQYYDEIGLLKPAAVKPSGYRLYDEAFLERLWRILFYKELGFSLEEIKKILGTSPETERKLMEKHRLLLAKKQARLAGMIKSIEGILAGAFDEAMLSDFNMKEFEREKRENQKITIRRLTEEDPFYDFFRPLIKYKLTTRTGVKSMLRNINSASNLDWDSIRLAGEKIGAAFVAAMPYGPESHEAMKAVAGFTSYLSEHLFSCENEVLIELSILYLKDADYINKDRAGLAEFVSDSLVNFRAVPSSKG